MLPRVITASSAIILAAIAGCILLLVPSPSTTTVPDSRHHRRALKLMPQREIVHYGDPKTVRRVNRQAGGAATPWWNDIDYHQRGLCGKEKCFFLSLEDPSRGYLVGHDKFDRTAAAYVLATELATEHGSRHFATAAPFEETTPEYFRQHLHGEYKAFYRDAASLVIQPMLTALEGSVVVRCYDPRVSLGRINYLLDGMDRAAMATLADELAREVRVVARRPELRTDFQLMLDRRGRAYHLDLDRVAKGPASRKDARHFEGCLEGAIDHVRKKMEAAAEAES